MSNLNKPVKFVHLYKLAYQSILNCALVKVMAKTSTVAFYEGKKILGRSIMEKEQRTVKIFIYKTPVSVNIDADQTC